MSVRCTEAVTAVATSTASLSQHGVKQQCLAATRHAQKVYISRQTHGSSRRRARDPDSDGDWQRKSLHAAHAWGGSTPSHSKYSHGDTTWPAQEKHLKSHRQVLRHS